MIEYLDCCLDANLSGESLVMKSLTMINTKLQFFNRQNKFLIFLFKIKLKATNKRKPRTRRHYKIFYILKGDLTIPCK